MNPNFAIEMSAFICNRRYFTIALAAGVTAGCDKKEHRMNESSTLINARQYVQQHRDLSPQRKALLLRIANDVERDYTTSIVRIHYRGRIYDIPANHMHLSGRTRFKDYLQLGAERYEFHATAEFLGDWVFFWPDLEGYTLDNWYDEFDRRIIRYPFFEVLLPGVMEKTTAEMFEHLKRGGMIESEPSAEVHGLKGYRRINDEVYMWVGTRSNGDFFMMSSFHPEFPSNHGGQSNPRCDVRLFTAATRESVMYHYSLGLFKHWREIDQRTQARIESWRVA